MAGIVVSMAPVARAEEATPAPAAPDAQVAPAAPAAPAAAAAPAAPAAKPAKAGDSKFRLGLGANYWVAIEDINDQGFDNNGLSGLVTFQYVPTSFFKLELDVELRPDGFLGSTQSVWLPQTYLLLGNFIYAGAGVGMYYTDGGFQNDPFFAFRGGIDIPIGQFHVDINANYRFEGSLDSSDISSDTIFLGAAVRYGF